MFDDERKAWPTGVQFLRPSWRGWVGNLRYTFWSLTHSPVFDSKVTCGCEFEGGNELKYTVQTLLPSDKIFLDKNAPKLP